MFTHMISLRIKEMFFHYMFLSHVVSLHISISDTGKHIYYLFTLFDYERVILLIYVTEPVFLQIVVI